MKTIVGVLILQVFSCILASSSSPTVPEDAAQNKTKRTIVGQTHNYGENRPPPIIYADSSASPSGITGFYSPVTIKPVFDPELPGKQVAAQQVLYEFQQTPTNAVSNVHVNQYYQPIPSINKQQETANSQYVYSSQSPNSEPSGNQGPAQFLHGAETVASPVQHSSLIRHGQNFAQVQFQPQHIQTQQYVPGKYLYVNGKILYQPQHQQQNTQPNQQLHYNNNVQPPRPMNYYYHNPQNQPQISQKLVPPAPGFGFRNFHPPQRHQYQQITKPMGSPEVTEEQNEEDNSEDNAPVKDQEDVEDDDEKESYEEGAEDEEDDHFGKYRFDEDDDHYENYKEEAEAEEDEEDSERGSSRHVPKKHKKKKSKPQKYNKSNNFKYSENYSTSSKYEKPEKVTKKGSKSPKMHYKSVKYSKQLNGKPRIERIEGRQSQNVPVVHKQNIFKEKKWFLTKSTDETSP